MSSAKEIIESRYSSVPLECRLPCPAPGIPGKVLGPVNSGYISWLCLSGTVESWSPWTIIYRKTMAQQVINCIKPAFHEIFNQAEKHSVRNQGILPGESRLQDKPCGRLFPGNKSGCGPAQGTTNIYHRKSKKRFLSRQGRICMIYLVKSKVRVETINC